MNFIRATKDKFFFQLGKREKRLLLEVLNLYPRIPSAYQPLTKTANLKEAEASQRLLDEALAEQRTENKRQLAAFLETPQRFSEHEAGSRLSLSSSELEWLLQILNDIRVGSWVILGSPEPKLEFKLLNEKTAPHFWAMEMSGYFQMHFLEALEGRT